MIYPVDSAIHRLNNRSLVSKTIMYNGAVIKTCSLHKFAHFWWNPILLWVDVMNVQIKYFQDFYFVAKDLNSI